MYRISGNGFGNIILTGPASDLFQPWGLCTRDIYPS